MEGQLLAHGGEFPFTPVPCLVTTAPPFGFCPSHPFPTPQPTLHYFYNDINNHGLLHSGQYRMQRSKFFPLFLMFPCADADKFSQSWEKTFCLENIFFPKKKSLSTITSVFPHKKAHKTKSFISLYQKFVIVSTKASHTQRKDVRMTHLLWKMELHIQYAPVKLRPHIYVPKEPGGFHAQEAAGFYQEEGESYYQVLGRGAVHTTSPFPGQNHRNKELVQPRYTCGLILCGAHYIFKCHR